MTRRPTGKAREVENTGRIRPTSNAAAGDGSRILVPPGFFNSLLVPECLICDKSVGVGVNHLDITTDGLLAVDRNMPADRAELDIVPILAVADRADSQESCAVPLRAGGGVFLYNDPLNRLYK